MTPRDRGLMASGPPRALWSLAVILASILGGLAAAAVVHLASRWIAVAIAAVIGSAVALALRRRSPAAPAQDPGLAGLAQPGFVPGAVDSYGVPAGRPAAEPVPARPGEPPAVVQVHRLPSAPGEDRPWWIAARETARPAGQDASMIPAPDLSSYLASAMIAQCPRCGAFRLDIRRGAARWTCRCEACGHTWAWQPGTAWPQVRVAPRRRKEEATPDPDARDAAS